MPVQGCSSVASGHRCHSCQMRHDVLMKKHLDTTDSELVAEWSEQDRSGATSSPGWPGLKLQAATDNYPL